MSRGRRLCNRAVFRDQRPALGAQVNRRMQMLAEGSNPRDVLASLRRDPRREAVAGLPILDRLDRLLIQAGSAAPVGQALLWMAVCGLLIFAVLRLVVALPPLPALLLAAGGGIGLPVFHLIGRKAWRRRRFEEQLPAALDLLVRSLRAGHPLNAAIAAVAQKMPDPIGSEFGIVVDEVTYGQALDKGLERLHQRVDLPDLRYLTMALEIQDGDSGNLAELLDGLARVTRGGFQDVG